MAEVLKTIESQTRRETIKAKITEAKRSETESLDLKTIGGTNLFGSKYNTAGTYARNYGK
jgi:hypothetical protein